MNHIQIYFYIALGVWWFTVKYVIYLSFFRRNNLHFCMMSQWRNCCLYFKKFLLIKTLMELNWICKYWFVSVYNWLFWFVSVYNWLFCSAFSNHSCWTRQRSAGEVWPSVCRWVGQGHLLQLLTSLVSILNVHRHTCNYLTRLICSCREINASIFIPFPHHH